MCYKPAKVDTESMRIRCNPSVLIYLPRTCIRLAVEATVKVIQCKRIKNYISLPLKNSKSLVHLLLLFSLHHRPIILLFRPKGINKRELTSLTQISR